MDKERHAILSRASAQDRGGLDHFPNVNLRVLPGDGRNSRTNLDLVIEAQEASSVLGSNRQRETQNGKDGSEASWRGSSKQFTSSLRCARLLPTQERQRSVVFDHDSFGQQQRACVGRAIGYLVAV